MNIQMPTENEKNASIDRILKRGLTPPNTLLQSASELIRALGFRYLFFGVEDCVFLSLITAAVAGGILVSASHSLLYTGLFLLSPLLYSLLFLITMWKEVQTDLFEIKMTCRYTLRHVTALRMLCFSTISVLFNVIMSAAAWGLSLKSYLLLRMLGISLSSLFLFALVLLLIQLYVQSSRVQIALTALWYTGTLCLLAMPDQRLETFLMDVPLAVVLVILTVSAAAYLWEIRTYFFARNKGDETYAHC